MMKSGLMLLAIASLISLVIVGTDHAPHFFQGWQNSSNKGTVPRAAEIARSTKVQPVAPSIVGYHSTTLTIHDRQGNPIRSLTDGNLISLTVEIPQKANQATPVTFELDSPGKRVAGCTILQGSKSCKTEPFTALGWYWSRGNPTPNRHLYAKSDVFPQTGMTAVQVAPRPVVLVHGFLSSASNAWSAYTGANGRLSSIGLSGYAVGDGQAEGVLSIGDLKSPTKRTNTIAENAQVLKQYIAGIKQKTGSEQVDLIAHSMGGLISRYYIDRLMEERDVAQLIMVASPHGGSNCANLPAALGFYLPATLELRPTYINHIFNPQITHRRGVPFYLFAGNPIIEAFKAPCTNVPSDLVVDLSSVATIGQPLVELPYLHIAMNRSQEVFRTFVEPLLKHEVDEFPVEPDPPATNDSTKLAQFTKIFTGHVAAGDRKRVTIHLDQVTIASFSLFDPTRSLQVIVRGASGKVIPLSADKHGYITVNDPTSLIYLGYGFKNPKPGPWNVTLVTTAKTPATGADYAIAAKVVGDAALQAQVSHLSPKINEPITLSASLALVNQPLKTAEIEATIRQPDGHSETLKLTGNTEKQVTWRPFKPGTYGIDVAARDFTLDGKLIERTTFLAVEVQPSFSKGWWSLISLIAAFGIGIRLLIVQGRRKKRREMRNQ
ncbi:hypothetical protein NDI45_16880 [Leptolyngbya sp. GB1-A1]|uniref:esterase/lipase family protein n=1 Tax=Leptolyngbya sp. GB1-A1 TaxID=2933908 RepID=UPI00329741C0